MKSSGFDEVEMGPRHHTFEKMDPADHQEILDDLDHDEIQSTRRL